MTSYPNKTAAICNYQDLLLKLLISWNVRNACS